MPGKGTKTPTLRGLDIALLKTAERPPSFDPRQVHAQPHMKRTQHVGGGKPKLFPGRTGGR